MATIATTSLASWALFGTVRQLHTSYRYCRLLADPASRKRLAAGVGLQVVAGQYSLVRMPAQTVMIARRVVDCSQRINEFKPAWEYLCRELQTPSVHEIYPNSIKSNIYLLLFRVNDIAMAAIAVISRGSLVILATWEIYSACQIDPGTQAIAVIESADNWAELRQTYKDNREAMVKSLDRDVQVYGLNIQFGVLGSYMVTVLDAAERGSCAMDHVTKRAETVGYYGILTFQAMFFLA